MSTTRPEDTSEEIEHQEKFATNQKLVAAQSDDQHQLDPAQLDNQQQLALPQDENRGQEAMLRNNELVALYNITGSPSMGDQIHHHYVPQQSIIQHGPQTVVVHLHHQQNVANISPKQSQQQFVLPITTDQQDTASTNQTAITSPSEIAQEVAAAISGLLSTHSSNEQTAEMASGIEEEENESNQVCCSVTEAETIPKFIEVHRLSRQFSISLPSSVKDKETTICSSTERKGHKKEAEGRSKIAGRRGSRRNVSGALVSIPKLVKTNTLPEQPSASSPPAGADKETTILSNTENHPEQQKGRSLIASNIKASQETHCFCCSKQTVSVTEKFIRSGKDDHVAKQGQDVDHQNQQDKQSPIPPRTEPLQEILCSSYSQQTVSGNERLTMPSKEEQLEAQANQMTLSLKKKYDAEMFVSNDFAPVPLQLTGYDADEIEEFGRSKVSASTRRLQLQPTVRSHQVSPDVEPCCLNRWSETDQTSGDRTPSQEKYYFELVVNQTFQCTMTSGFYKIRELFAMSAKSAAANADRNRNIVGAIGSAGNGKTTFAKQMVQGIFEDNPNQLPFVFYIPFKSIDFSEKMTVFQFLVRYSFPDCDHSPETDKDMLKLINTSDNVYIITEALDETDVKRFTKATISMSLYQSATPDVIIKNIFSGRLLPKAKKLITSRPGAFHDLHPDCKPQFVVKVIGLSEESQKLLCQQLCDDRKEYEQVQQQLDSNPNISVLCCNPMHCKMIVKHLRKNAGEHLDAVSSTSVFASTFDDCIRSEHFKGETETLLRLTALALRGMKEDKFIFDQNDLDTSDIKYFETFLNLTISGRKDLGVKIFDGDKRFFFVHLLWQEFFAAIHLIFFSKLDDFNSLFPYLSENRWDSVVKFMFGFLNPSVYEKLLAIFPVSSKPDIDVKKNKLKSLIPSSIPDSLDSLSKICCCALESNDQFIKRRVTSSLPPTITFHGEIFPIDISHFARILATDQSNPRHINIDLKNPTFHGNGLKILLDAVNLTPHKVRSISYNVTRISEHEASCISQHINNIEKMKLSNCNLTVNVIQILSDAIQRRTDPLKELDLSGNILGPLGLKLLFHCVGKVKKLYLEECRINETDVKELSIRISQIDQPLEELHLRGNALTSLGLKHLSLCVGKVQSLCLDSCSISEDAVPALALKISQRDQPIEKLDLSWNNLSSLGMKHLSQCVDKVQKLTLHKCDISGADTEELAMNISQRGQPLEKLDLSFNDLGSLGLKHISQCVGKVQKLIFSGCEVSGADMEELAISVSHRDQPLHELNLSSNNLGSLGLKHLSSCVGKIQNINIRGCDITGDDMEELTIIISHLNQSLKSLDLSKNKLGSLGLKHLSQCVDKVQKLNLGKCCIDGNDIEELAIKISQLNQPIENLNLSFNNLGSLGVKHLSLCIGKVQTLVLRKCRITRKEIEILAIRISHLNQPMEMIDLQLNDINDESVKFLCQCLHKIQNLWLGSNKITEVGKQAIRSVLARDDVNCDVDGLEDQQSPRSYNFL